MTSTCHATGWCSALDEKKTFLDWLKRLFQNPPVAIPVPLARTIRWKVIRALAKLPAVLELRLLRYWVFRSVMILPACGMIVQPKFWYRSTRRRKCQRNSIIPTILPVFKPWLMKENVWNGKPCCQRRMPFVFTTVGGPKNLRKSLLTGLSAVGLSWLGKETTGRRCWSWSLQPRHVHGERALVPSRSPWSGSDPESFRRVVESIRPHDPNADHGFSQMGFATWWHPRSLSGSRTTARAIPLYMPTSQPGGCQGCRRLQW